MRYLMPFRFTDFLCGMLLMYAAHGHAIRINGEQLPEWLTIVVMCVFLYCLAVCGAVMLWNVVKWSKVWWLGLNKCKLVR